MNGAVQTARVARPHRPVVAPVRRPYPAYRDPGIEWLGRVPAHWPVRRLKYLAAVRPSNVDKQSVEGQAEVRLCNYNDVYKNDRIVEGLDFMRATATDVQIRTFELRADDVLITKDSETWTDIAVPAHVLSDLAGVVCGYHLAVLRPRGERFRGDYLFWLLASRRINHQFAIAANGITRFGLSTDAITGSWLPCPDVAEQRAIAAFLDRETARIDALVEKKQRLIELLREKRHAVITQAVTRGLDPDAPMKDSDIEYLGQVPAHWSTRKWRYSCRISEGQVAPEDERYRDRVLIAPNHVESGTGRILNTETADEQGAISGKYLVDRGDLIYSKIRPELNKACIAKGDWLCSADMYAIKVTDGGIDVRYLLYFVLSEPFVRTMVDESMRVAMPKVNRDTLAACPLLVPPSVEQAAIAAFLDRETSRLDALIAKIDEHIALLREHRQALIMAAVTGQIDVRDEVPA